MATKPSSKKFRGGTVGELADDVYAEITAINAVTAQNIALAALTDNSGGAAGNDTIAAITEAGNAGSADVGPTADAIADLAAKINEIRTALIASGILS